MNDNDLQTRGAKVIRQLMSKSHLKRGAPDYDHPIMRKFVDVVTPTFFGALWDRPGLDLKTRVLVVLISDVSSGRIDEFKIHAHMALRQGWTEDELTEALIQLIGYIGAPLVREASLALVDVLREEAAEPRPER